MRNRLSLLTLAPCLVATLGATSDLHAQTRRNVLADFDTHRSGISGFRGTKENVLEPGNSAFLYGLEFDEAGDKPCHIRAHWWRYNQTDAPSDFNTLFDICSSRQKGDETITFAGGATSKTAVNAIQVCNNGRDNHRLKGAKIEAVVVDQGGSGKNVPAIPTSSRSFERTNCADPWKATRRCDAGAAAIGLVIKHTGDEVVGLGLKCARTLIKPTSEQDTALSRFNDMENDIRVEVDKNGTTQTMSITAALVRHEVAGATVVIIDDHAIALVRHYGMRDAKAGLPTNGDTFYVSASISKFIGALAMARAARLDHGPSLTQTAGRTAAQHPDSLLARWVKRKFKGDAESYPDEITVRRLLGHSAGLKRWGIGTGKADNKTEMETILMGDIGIAGTNVRARPGTDWCYSGGGFTVAEAMLELHAGRSARAFVNEEIFDAYGMRRSTANEAKDDMTNLARGCSRDLALCNNKPRHSEVKFAGGLLVHPEDYAHLLTLISRDGRDANNQRVIERADLREVMTPTDFRSSSLAACKVSSGCAAGEVCQDGTCMKPMTAQCEDSDWNDWYGMGLFLDDTAMNADGYSDVLYHGGTNRDDNVATSFQIRRSDGSGFVFMINGKYEWKKKKVTYGGGSLRSDLENAYSVHFP